jgi:hypothetical protein
MNSQQEVLAYTSDAKVLSAIPNDNHSGHLQA